MPYIGNVLTSFAVETGNINDQAVTAPKLSATGGTDGQVLALDSNLNLEWVSDPAGQWVTSGTDLTYTAGNVGIGTTSPSVLLHVSSSGDTIARVTSADGNGAFLDLGDASDPDGGRIVYDSGSNLTFSTASSERLRIDSSGRLLHGTSASVTANSETRNVQIVTDVNNANQGLGIYAFTASNNAPRLDLGSSPNGSVNTFTTASSSGGLCGRINFLGSDGDEFLPTARIEGRVDGTAGNGDMPGRLVFSTTADGASSPTERLRIDSSGNVGIGATAPAAKLDVAGNQIFTAANPQIQFNAGGPIIRLPSANTLAFLTDSTNERMRIDSSGRLVVGVSSGVQVAGSQSFIQHHGNKTTSSLALAGYANNSGGPILSFGGSRSTTVGTPGTIVSSGDHLGDIRFAGDDGTDINSVAASIRGEVDGTPGSNDMPGRLVFSTTADGASSATERMRITSIGTVGIGVTSPAAGASNTPALDVDGPILASRPLAAHQTSKGVLQRSGNVIALRAYGETAGTGQIAFNTGGGGGSNDNERVRIDTSGNVGIGTSSPGTRLHVNGSTPIMRVSHGSTQIVEIKADTDASILRTTTNHPLLFGTNDTEQMRITNSGSVGIGITSPTSQSGKTLHLHNSGGQQRLHLTTNNSGSAAGDGLDIILEHNTDGDAHILNHETNGDLKLGAGDAERVRLLSTGGMTFGGDTAQVNALEDYEEGSWTPAAFDNANGASTQVNRARYTKIGNRICFECYIRVSKGTNTGNYEIHGLPYDSNSSSSYHSGIAASYFSGWSTSVSMIQATVQAGSDHVLVRAISGTSNTGTVSATGNFLNATTEIIIGGTYETA